MRGLSQAALARASGFSPAYIRDLETGRRFPREDFTQAIADALNVRIEDLGFRKIRSAPQSCAMNAHFGRSWMDGEPSWYFLTLGVSVAPGEQGASRCM